MNIEKMTVAYTRDHNLRDILIPSKLPNLPTHTASQFLQTQQNKLSQSVSTTTTTLRQTNNNTFEKNI